MTSAPRIGEWTLHEELGRGGMGVVHRATRDDGREAALKLLDAPFASAEALARFEREARVIERLDHPGIVRFLDSGVAATPRGRQPWIAMELVEGRSLSDAAADPAWNVRSRLECLARIADALAHAHAAGVVHRDLKPANVIRRPDGTMCLLDFGVATIAAGDEAAETLATRTGMLVGTVHWMSPEQVLGVPGAAGPPTDVHALGLLAHFLLTGEGPWGPPRESIADAIVTIAHEPPRRLRASRPELPEALDELVAAALAKAPAQRPDARSLAADLRLVAAGRRTGLAGRRNRRRALALLAVALPALIAVVTLCRPSFDSWTLRHDGVLAARTLDVYEGAELVLAAAPDSAASAPWVARLEHLEGPIAQLPPTPLRNAARALLLHAEYRMRLEPSRPSGMLRWFHTRAQEAWDARNLMLTDAAWLRPRDARWQRAFRAYRPSHANEDVAVAHMPRCRLHTPFFLGRNGAVFGRTALIAWGRENGHPTESIDALWSVMSADSLERPRLWMIYARGLFDEATEDTLPRPELVRDLLDRLAAHPTIRTRPDDVAWLTMARAVIARLDTPHAPGAEAWGGPLAAERAAALARGSPALAREIAIEQAERFAAGIAGAGSRAARLRQAVAVLDTALRWPAEPRVDDSFAWTAAARAHHENELARATADTTMARRALEEATDALAGIPAGWFGASTLLELEAARALSFLYAVGGDPATRLAAESAIGRATSDLNPADWPRWGRLHRESQAEFERFRAAHGDPEL